MVLGNLARIRGRRGEHLEAIGLGRRAVDLARVHSPQLVGSLLADLAEDDGDLHGLAVLLAVERVLDKRRRPRPCEFLNSQC